MTRREVIDIIRGLEEKYPVDSWKINDVDLWPIVKFNLFALWRTKQNAKYDALLKSVANTPSIISLLISRTFAVFYFIKLLLQKKKSISILLVGENTHRVMFGEEYINRYFQPIIDTLRVKYSSDALLLEYQYRDSKKKYKSLNEIVFLDKYLFIVKILTFFKRKKHTMQLSGFEDFIHDINNHFPGLVNYETYLKALCKKVEIIRRYAYLYEIFFKKYSPRYAMCLCYYTNAGYGMTYAAHKNNIVSFDMQHGGQGILHPSYSEYNKIPEKGFNTLPKIFWCWDRPSANTIQKWLSKQAFHQVIVGGNPWLTYFRSNTAFQYVFPEKKKIILYTLQLNEPEDYIVEAIKMTSSDHQWWLRLHPRTLKTRSHLEALLKKNGIFDKVEIDKATNYPLPHILKNTHMHVTRSSGSAIEAAQLGVKTILINEIGIENYSEYVENGDAFPFLAESSEELINLISEVASLERSSNNEIRFETTLAELFG